METTMLVSVAEISNMFSVLSVLLCFVVTAFLILRLQNSHTESMQSWVPQTTMQKVELPFSMHLSPAAKSTLTCCPCIISSQVPYCVQDFWGVSIQGLHRLIQRPWQDLRAHLSSSNLMGHCEVAGEPKLKTVHAEEEVHFAASQTLRSLETIPRSVYPLVVFLVDDSSRDPPSEGPKVVALVNIIHIRDDVYNFPSRIVAQYLKLTNGQVLPLQQLYLASASESSPGASEGGGGGGGGDGGSGEGDGDGGSEAEAWVPAEEEEEEEASLCLICQNWPVSRALLPCRHTCVCASCFGRLDRCPICRSPIHSFFCIRSEDSMPQQPPAPLPVLTWSQRLEQWNDRLNALLGFHD